MWRRVCRGCQLSNMQITSTKIEVMYSRCTAPEFFHIRKISGLTLAMVELPQCAHLKRDGQRCTNRTYNEQCHLHKGKQSHALCLNRCGRGTISVTGYCKQCRAGMQGSVLQKMRRAGCGVKQLEIQRKKEEAEWDAYIDSLCDS